MRRIAVYLGLVVLAALTVVSGAFAQTTYNSLSVTGVPGEAEATFVFGHAINGQPGTTELIVKCDRNQAWLITNFDTGQQATSAVFAISCASSNPNGPYTVNNTPLSNTLNMYDSAGNVVGSITLTVNSASFTVSAGRWHPSTGSATITY